MSEYNCSNCLYEATNESIKPCSKCFDSFTGRVFPKPSEWEPIHAKTTPKGTNQK